ncbi:MAG TPA: hypothetical protein VNT75_08870, partial [Symbiobacteriaceae bacterium]|nr:hypothetical protein [Symbiobacteriaceae bacterium]
MYHKRLFIITLIIMLTLNLTGTAVADEPAAPGAIPQVFAGYDRSAAIMPDGTTRLWTAAETGAVALDVTGLRTLTLGRQHLLAVDAGGKVRVWPLQDATAPGQTIADIDDAVAVAALGSRALALKADGTIWTWWLDLPAVALQVDGLPPI